MREKFLILTVLLLAFVLRLYRINNPIADWHSWRQADTSAVSRNFVKKGFDFLHPRFDDLSDVPSGLENPEGYRFVEFPVYNLIQAGLFKALPAVSLEVWGRLFSILSSLGSLVFLYLIVKKYLGTKIALITAFFFAILPFNIYYSRVILPEPMMLMICLGMIYFFARWIETNFQFSCLAGRRAISNFQFSWNNFTNLALAMTFAALSFLLKPFTLVFLLPITYLAWENWRFNFKKYFSLYLCILVSLLPFFWWRWWMSHFPEGIPFSAWLFNLSRIRFKGAFFWWIFAEKIGKLILGYWGLILLGLGLVVKRNKKEGLFFLSWLVAILVYFAIVAGGNVRHDYYQILAIPIICVFLAKGVYFLLTAPRSHFSSITCYLLLVTCILFMFAFSWYQVRDFFNINNPVIVEAGRAADQILPKDAKVIAPYGGDSAFLYQTNRQGWPVGIEIEKMVNLGAQYYVNVNFGPETQWVMEKYRVLKKTSNYVIVDLKKGCRQ